MAQIFVEFRDLSNGVSLSWDMAHHLYTRYRAGAVVIITENPLVLLASLRKQWLKVVGKMKKEYASTMNATRKEGVNRIVTEMETLPFILALPTKEVADKPGVYIITPAQAEHISTMHYTIYTTYKNINKEGLSEQIFDYGALVRYGPI